MKSLFLLLLVTIFILNCVSIKNEGSGRKGESTPTKNLETDTIILGKKFTLNSKILGDKRPYWVHLPNSYSSTLIYPKRYPVLYLLDGDTFFLPASGVVNFMSAGGQNNNYQIPELIIVAIPNKDDRWKNYTPTQIKEGSGGGDNFLKFLKEELIPQIESKYRTIPLRILVGHSMGGLIATYDFLNSPPIFNAHIAIDPSLWWDNFFISKQAKNASPEYLNGSIYLSTFEKAMHREKDRGFITTLDNKKAANLRTKFQVFDSEDHATIPLLSLYNGLLFIFDGYQPHSLNDFVAEPSLIEKHFKKVAKNLGIDFLPPEDLIHGICTHTVKEKPEKAIECFKINVSNYPESFNSHNALAKIYLNKGEKKLAITHYQKALDLNPNNQIAIEALEKLK